MSREYCYILLMNPVKETAYRLHFFEPNHMMRFL